MIQICRTKFWLSLAHISFSTMDIQQNFYIPVFSTVGFEYFLIQPHCFCINKYYQVLFIATCERAIVSCSFFLPSQCGKVQLKISTMDLFSEGVQDSRPQPSSPACLTDILYWKQSKKGSNDRRKTDWNQFFSNCLTYWLKTLLSVCINLDCLSKSKEVDSS